MTQRKNRQFLLVSRPVGMPADENFELREAAVPELEDGQVLVRTLYLSVDPYMRGRMSDAKSYVEPFALGEVLQGGVVGEIVESKNERWKAGDVVVGLLGWQEYSVSNGRGLLKIDPSVAPITTALHVVGMTGLTAYFGLLDIGKPQEGETVVVSGAAGAVGTVVGQIAKIKGCRVVGIAGDDEKCAYLTEELGFDAAINYKTADLNAALKESCPNGVDVYFDNVGGDITEAVMRRINFQARIPICGQISQYNLEKPDLGPRIVFTQLLKSSALAKGFIVNDYAKQHKEGMQQLAQWVMEGKIKYRENIVDGLENVVEAFLGLFRGDNIGKQLVKVADL
ncbi:NADP-dependent oxidoreductase [Tumebacillus flagellatus]|uniref:Alcohol dehydrogenase n=1 Tax=Tumebacillus flagellatus TaxID=1157490 RepID=A0A074LMN2_9BACL|nr:NADP-dependent oxidoreductase [Tumebacillus flagellatus]KEO82399.1 alcohol dehydrogenase [Tumebacillus flagellatus]